MGTSEKIVDITDDKIRLALLEQGNKNLDLALYRIDKQLEKLDIKVTRNDEKMNTEIRAIFAWSWVQFTFLFAMITGVLAILARAEGWV